VIFPKDDLWGEECQWDLCPGPGGLARGRAGKGCGPAAPKYGAGPVQRVQPRRTWDRRDPEWSVLTIDFSVSDRV